MGSQNMMITPPVKDLQGQHGPRIPFRVNDVTLETHFQPLREIWALDR